MPVVKRLYKNEKQIIVLKPSRNKKDQTFVGMLVFDRAFTSWP
jgi:hypothetical protein